MTPVRQAFPPDIAFRTGLPPASAPLRLESPTYIGLPGLDQLQ